MKEFPKLYKKTTTGAIQEWTVSVDEINGIPTIINRFGQVGGKIQYSHEQVLTGKNTGRANATTALEQAEAQAKSRWEKQLKKGYVENPDDAQEGKTDAIIEGGIFPMLAHKFSEQGHKIKYKALAQSKLDGHRCISQYDENREKVTLWSRTRKPINSVPHIVKALEKIMMLKNIKYFDGELYSHAYHNKFEELSHFIRQEEYLEGSEIVEYHIYDLPHPSMTNEKRNDLLQSLKPLFEGKTSDHVLP